MATHSSILAWGIPQTEEPGGRWSIGLHGVGYDGNDLAHMHARRLLLKPRFCLVLLLFYSVSLVIYFFQNPILSK